MHVDRTDFPAVRSLAQCPVKDCLQPVDIALKSCDGKLIGCHRSYLGWYSGRLSTATVVQDILPLDETAEVLLIMVEFMHPRPPPILRGISLNLVLRLAYAAQKYEVFSAKAITKQRLSHLEMYEQQPARVFYYAVKYNCTKLADTIAPMTLGLKFPEVLDAFCHDSEVFTHWALFYDTCRRHMVRCKGSFSGWPFEEALSPETSLGNRRGHSSTGSTDFPRLSGGQVESLPSFTNFCSILASTRSLPTLPLTV
ncbi:hypothetical protein C8J56DRAFT_813116 [Mycena floridula]|nr:hypothetical protein C8J56DRAFT_813116 [Mycena floridula]